MTEIELWRDMERNPDKYKFGNTRRTIYPGGTMSDEVKGLGVITEAMADKAADQLTHALKAVEPPHPYETDDALNDRLYNVSRKVDKILHREPVENHAAILGMIQVSTQRRMHEHQQAQQKEAQAKAAQARFGVQ